MIALSLPHTPVLFFVLSFWAGSLLILSVALWLRDIQSGKNDLPTLKQSVITALARGLTLTIFTAIGLAIAAGEDINIQNFWPEWSMLAVIISYYSLQVTKGHSDKTKIWKKSIILEAFQLVFLALLTVMIWALSVLIGIAVMHLSYMGLQNGLPFEPVRDAVMMVGLLWMLPYILLYQKASKKAESGTIKLPEHFRFHKLLWPVLLALLIFMVPLIIENFFISGKYEEMQKPRQVLHII